MQVINQDITSYIKTVDQLSSVFTSIPDMEEINQKKPDDYINWFKNRALDIMQKTDPNGYCIFYQTDRKKKGGLISKSSLLLQVASTLDLKVIYHKICTTTKPGKTNFFRPGYTHLICFSKKGTSGRATPDVFPSGKKIYKNATGFGACIEAFSFLQKKRINLVYDLFCGAGSIAFIGKKYFDMEVISVDIDPDQCRKTEELLKTIQPTL